ncbi:MULTISPECIES: hypothetical protein [Thermocrispum]|nr:MULTISPECIES: hypothetical protein [Thermocrispum]
MVLPARHRMSMAGEPEQLSRYFTTGGARGRLAPGEEATWDFHDFPARSR